MTEVLIWGKKKYIYSIYRFKKHIYTVYIDLKNIYIQGGAKVLTHVFL
jgi:hypothetical protein